MLWEDVAVMTVKVGDASRISDESCVVAIIANFKACGELAGGLA